MILQFQKLPKDSEKFSESKRVKVNLRCVESRIMGLVCDKTIEIILDYEHFLVNVNIFQKCAVFESYVSKSVSKFF